MNTKDRINKLIDIYLVWLERVEHAAGGTGETMIQRLITYKGDLPPPSGNDQADLSMINACEKLGNAHAQLGIAKLLLSRLPCKRLIALLVSRHYRITRDRERRERTDLELAEFAKMECREYRYYRDKAYEEMEPNLLLVIEVKRLSRVA